MQLSRLLLTLSLIATPFFALANPAKPEVQSVVTVEQLLLNKSGLLTLNDQVRFTAQQIFNQQAINRNMQFSIAKSLSQKWATDLWQKKLMASIRQLSGNQQQRLLLIFQQQDVAKFRQLEAQTIAVQASEEFKSYQQKVRGKTPSPTRLQLIQEVDKYSKMSELIIAARLQAYQEIALQIEGWQVPENWQLDTVRQTQEFLLYLFRRTSNQGMKDLIAQYRQPEVQQLLGLVAKEVEKL